MSEAVRVLLISISWITIHIGSGFLAHHMPLRWFQADRWCFRSRSWEQGGAFYRRYFAVDRLRRRLPEAGSLFAGGFSKASLLTSEPAYLARFVAETRRAELSHWMAVGASLFFFFWNPLHIAIWMPVYAVITNIPFVIVQRAVRPRLQALHRASLNRKKLDRAKAG
ncbi:MAG: hypothetical protein ACLFM0_06175 [Spirochaetales bacterium]